MTRWGKVIDHRKCIGCHACTVACKAEHEVPLGVTRTYVKQVEVGHFPTARRHFQVTRCNQCEDAPCVAICPVEAMYQRPDGIVDFDREVCIGCKACMAACPYDAIYIDPQSHSAEKCSFCAHRIDQGLEPACVVVCPEEAIIVGDLDDPTSEVSTLLAREKAEVRKPEKGTQPKVFYLESNLYTRVPGLALTPSLHASSEQREGYPVAHEANLIMELLTQSGFGGTRRPAAAPGSTTAAAILSYDVPHKMPWDWRVSAYTWTKSVAAGAYAIPALLSLLGVGFSPAFGLAATVLAGVFLALTGVLLILDLEHPERFLSILFRPQWRSWLARGAYVITGYGLVLGLDGLGRLLGWPQLVAALRWPGIPLALLTALYTAFLFAQARGRDLWQSPTLPLHLLAQAGLAGSAALVLLAGATDAGLTPLLGWVMAGSVMTHLLLVVAEVILPHPTRDAARAGHQMVRGAYAAYYWTGMALILLATLALALGWGIPAAVMALAGLLAHEHAYVQSGQSVALS